MDSESAELEREVRALASRAPLPAAPGNIVLGTAGWTDPSLLKGSNFYPKSASKPQQRLQHYANHFSLVEVDASYYTILRPEISARWVNWTPQNFVFDIKTHASMTGHPVDLLRLPKELREEGERISGGAPKLSSKQLPQSFKQQLELAFEAFVKPLIDHARLGCLMFQFPPWFAATRGNARRLEQIRERWGSVPISIEFRHPSWLHPERRQRVEALLRRLGFSYVIVDEPQVKGGGVPPMPLVTQPELALFRFHGHNRAGWHRGASVAEKYDYLYFKPELTHWLTPVRAVAKDAARVHVIFNNCVRDYAVVDAKALGTLLAVATDADTAPPDEA